MTESTAVVTRQPTLVLAGISKRFGGVAALTDVSLELSPGEVHALLGENGAGKSTLMGVASGELRPDEGSLVLDGDVLDSLDPAAAAEAGIAIVHQHPAVLSDMTVAENLRIAVPEARLRETGDERDAMQALLDDVRLPIHLEDRVVDLTVAQKHLLELTKALAVRPRVLILDEPTAPLGQEAVDMLFDRVRQAAKEQTAVVYITHRLAEVRALAQRVTVLRDGRLRGSLLVDDVSDEELLALIIGRELETTFPAKLTGDDEDEEDLRLDAISGTGFSDVSLIARRGEIVGIAGVVGNGQAELLRALAGLEPFSGSVTLARRPRSSRELRKVSGYMPADRHHDGLMMSLSVRENAALSGLGHLRRGPVVPRPTEVREVGRELSDLGVKTPTMESIVSALSGGNQQKVVLARALLAKPSIIIADEPTQGVDVGARAEIYRILRAVALEGVPVVVASSDAKELEGLCDRVVVMSRGHIVTELVGEEITETRMIRAAVEATSHKDVEPESKKRSSRSPRLKRFLRGDYAPVAILALVMVLLGAYIYSRNSLYLSAFNVNSVMLLVAALGFIAMGQTVALLMAGIDLSVGPLAGFLVVVGSFFLNDGAGVGMMLLGFLLMLGSAAATGAVNGSLIRFGRFTPVAATLVTYIALQGFSFLLRDAPEGVIARSLTDTIMTKVGSVPVVFVLLLVVVAAMEWLLRRSTWGHRIRAVGSDEDAARRMGVKVTRTVVTGYVITSLFVFLGSLVLLAQLGIGDPAQGVSYTLSSITAVVLGGTSLLGGRGTFVGTLLGAGIIVQVLNATTFLGLTQTWQYFFQGAFIVVAAVLYSRVRGTHEALT